MIRKPEGYSPEFWQGQKAEFAKEAQAIERLREETKRFIRDQLTQDARILVFDLAGVQSPEQVGDEDLARQAREFQFGGVERATYGESIRQFLGFEERDPRVTIWEAAANQRIDRRSLPYPDIWVTSGGEEMRWELGRGKETGNTEWLRRVVGVMKELRKARVPGLAICLGHQLWQYMEGAKVGPVGGGRREFGTPELYPAGIGEELQLLQGFWDERKATPMAASHSEGVRLPSKKEGVRAIAWNDYMKHQGFAHPLRKGQDVREADIEDELVVSLQNHPDVATHWAQVIKLVRGEAMMMEGLDPASILLKATPEAKKIWLNLLELTARRLKKRQKAGMHV